MKTGDIFFYSGNTWLSRTIKKFTNCEWSHSGIVFIDNSEIFILELQVRKAWQLPRVGLTPIEFYKGKKYTTIPYPKKYSIDIGLSMCGTKPYDIATLAVFQVIRQLSKTYLHKDLWIGRKGNKAANRFVCSEFVAYVINQSTGDFYNWWEISPADIYNKLKK